MDKAYVKVGDTIEVKLPWSEVCVHMKVADKRMAVTVTENGAQLLDDSGAPFSFPITHGEAGIYQDSEGRLYVRQ